MSDVPIIVSLKDLEQGVADDQLPLAFGHDSLGIIIVKDLPEKYQRLRKLVLSSACDIARLPDIEKAKLENKQAQWLVGWSCGKEKLSDDRVDDLKGSYYVNCSFYHDAEAEGPTLDEENQAKYKDLKSYTASNLWPDKQLMPEFEANLKELCCLVIDVAVQVSKACDRYVGGKIVGYTPGYLEHIVRTSSTTKARLLHYFPIDKPSNNDDWCGEHLDHSCLTGLTSAMFVRETNTAENKRDPVLTEEIECPDPESGLYIKNRRGQVVKVKIPKDCLAFQTGSALQEVTMGQFKAVPHYVKGTPVPGVSRNTLAIFCQPSLNEPVGRYQDFATFATEILNQNH